MALLIEPQSIAEILGLGPSIRTVNELESAVSAGLPKRSLEKLSTRLYEDRRVANAYKFKGCASGNVEASDQASFRGRERAYREAGARARASGVRLG